MVGFFDHEGYYFDQKGFDEAGGYYDDYGEYRDADYVCEEEYAEDEDHTYNQYVLSQHIEPLLEAISGVREGCELNAILSNLPYKATKEEIEKGLKDHNIPFVNMEMKYDKSKNLKSVNLRVKDKESAKGLAVLHGAQFLGRNLKVDFPDFSLEEVGGIAIAIPNTEAVTKKDVPKPEQSKPENPPKAEVKKKEVSPKEEEKKKEVVPKIEEKKPDAKKEEQVKKTDNQIGAEEEGFEVEIIHQSEAETKSAPFIGKPKKFKKK